MPLPSYSSPCPEIVIGQIAAHTQQIKVGSGGIMLSHYSPYKVAEVFRTLEAFFPGRIDLGFGRAPGGAELPSRALAYPNNPVNRDIYPELVEALVGFTDNRIPADHPFGGLQVTPTDSSAPDLWTLGSAAGSIDPGGTLRRGICTRTVYRHPRASCRNHSAVQSIIPGSSGQPHANACSDDLQRRHLR